MTQCIRVRFFPALVATLALSAGWSCGTNPEPPPNVVMIISDDHAWTDYGFMGHPVATTPNLDNLAADSMLYTRGYVPPVCRPSLAQLATGLYPHQNGITGNDPPENGLGPMNNAKGQARMVEVFQKNHTLPELLSKEGYVSHQSGKWWEGNPLDQGFSAAMTHGDPTRGGRHGDDGLKVGREGMEPVFDFIDSAGEQPFFIWYAPFLPHTPHNPPERLLSKYTGLDIEQNEAKYYAMVEWFDETVGQLLDHLDQNGLRENTLVLYVADNGWISRPDGPRTDGRVWTRAKMSPYEMGIRSPVMIRWPGKVEPGRDDKTLVSTIDFAQTVLHGAGTQGPSNLPGIDLLDREALARREMVFGAHYAHTAADVDDPVANLKYREVIRNDGWKLILPYEPNKDVPLMIRPGQVDWATLDPELYNVVADPHEEHDQASERPEIVAELRAALDGWLSVPD